MALIRSCGPDWLDAKLTAGEILIIDGAMGTELEARGVPMHAQAWSAAAIKTLRMSSEAPTRITYVPVRG